MNDVDRLIARLERSGLARRELARAGTFVGGQLVHAESRDELRRLRAALARTSTDREPYADGYARALLDVLAASEVHREATETDREIVEAVAERSEWREVLSLVDGGVCRPAALAEKLGKDAGHVSRVLSAIRGVGLLEVHQPPGGDGRSRPHRLTLRGERVLKQMGTSLARRSGPPPPPSELSNMLWQIYGSGVLPSPLAEIAEQTRLLCIRTSDPNSWGAVVPLFQKLGVFSCQVTEGPSKDLDANLLLERARQEAVLTIIYDDERCVLQDSDDPPMKELRSLARRQFVIGPSPEPGLTPLDVAV
ncbi:MAG: MarR family winged helix-turn-helix transcriptional regulator [Sandaracinaceae bacterium]